MDEGEHSSDLSEEERLKANRMLLSALNEYLFQTSSDYGGASFNGEIYPYVSEFHKYWESHFKDLLGLKINDERAKEAAIALSSAKRRYGDAIFRVTHNVAGLPPEKIAQVRYFTANQDFRGSIIQPYQKIREDPSKFNKVWIKDHPENYITFLEVTGRSQGDKRVQFAKTAAEFLIELGVDAFGLAQKFNNDAVALREAMVNRTGIGYGQKKANMFIRDMVELGVWRLDRFSEMDVASDINTVKLGLRTGVIETEIPLVSSFLDQFCHQYMFIDEMSAKAWRRVWTFWKEVDPETAPASPCQMDFLLYSLGQDYCKKILAMYRCETGHEFFHLGRRIRKCTAPICRRSGRSVELVKDLFPCQVDPSQLPREGGMIAIDSDNLLYTFDGRCFFESVCRPREPGFVPLDPPKSISVKGETGWTKSYAEKGRGGGGMMG